VGGGLVAAWIAVGAAATAIGSPTRLPLITTFTGALAVIAVSGVLGRP